MPLVLGIAGLIQLGAGVIWIGIALTAGSSASSRAASLGGNYELAGLASTLSILAAAPGIGLILSALLFFGFASALDHLAHIGDLLRAAAARPAASPLGMVPVYGTTPVPAAKGDQARADNRRIEAAAAAHRPAAVLLKTLALQGGELTPTQASLIASYVRAAAGGLADLAEAPARLTRWVNDIVVDEADYDEAWAALPEIAARDRFHATARAMVKESNPPDQAGQLEMLEGLLAT